MKKVSRISLHNLSKAELANNEMNQLRGGSGICIGICGDSICRCVEGASGNFDSSVGIMERHINTEAEKKACDDAYENLSPSGTVN